MSYSELPLAGSIKFLPDMYFPAPTNPHTILPPRKAFGHPVVVLSVDAVLSYATIHIVSLSFIYHRFPHRNKETGGLCLQLTIVLRTKDYLLWRQIKAEKATTHDK